MLLWRWGELTRAKFTVQSLSLSCSSRSHFCVAQCHPSRSCIAWDAEVGRIAACSEHLFFALPLFDPLDPVCVCKIYFSLLLDLKIFSKFSEDAKTSLIEYMWIHLFLYLLSYLFIFLTEALLWISESWNLRIMQHVNELPGAQWSHMALGTICCPKFCRTCSGCGSWGSAECGLLWWEVGTLSLGLPVPGLSGLLWSYHLDFLYSHVLSDQCSPSSTFYWLLYSYSSRWTFSSTCQILLKNLTRILTLIVFNLPNNGRDINYIKHAGSSEQILMIGAEALVDLMNVCVYRMMVVGDEHGGLSFIVSFQ